MPLHVRRKRLESLAEREAAGESFWVSQFDETVRIRLSHIFDELVGDQRDGQDVAIAARAMILLEAGLLYLTFADYQRYPNQDFREAMLTASDELFPSVIESIAICMRTTGRNASNARRRDLYSRAVNQVFREHRVSWELIDEQMVEYESRELHVEVTAPTLTLLARSGMEAVEDPFRQALAQIADGNPANAITDAGTALQKMLEAKGCVGNSLGPLIKSARKDGLLLPHDSPLTDSLLKIMDWVSADRSELGDAHASTDANLEDAWLAVHIVGAFIVRLNSDRPRAS